MEKSDNKLELIFPLSYLLIRTVQSLIFFQMEDRVREPNYKLQVEENLHACNLTTTSTTLLTGPSTNVTTSPAADDAGWVFHNVHHVRDLSAVDSIHPNWQGSPIKHPKMKVEKKSTTAVEFHGPSSSGASQEQPDPGQLIQLKKDCWKVLAKDKNR